MKSTAQAPQVEARDGMLIEWDAPIPMDDGVVLRGDVFRPLQGGCCPVLMTHGPYGKGLTFREGYPDQWEILVRQHPDVAAVTSNAYQAWEAPDPEKWIPHGYACVRVDSRGTGRSPGRIDPLSPRETRDYYECIEWAGTRPWSDGKVGLTGISYYAMNQWQVAALRPPHLAAICPWEGASDWYRDATHHGGILTPWWEEWLEHQVRTVQHGLGARGPRNPVRDLPVCGDIELDDEELGRNRIDLGAEIRSHPFIDEYYEARIPNLENIEIPLLSAGNWGGHGLHLRGNTEGFVRAGSRQKWLELHGLQHFAHYYTDYGRELQKRFFDHFLKGDENGWDEQPPVQLNVRHVDGSFTLRHEDAWPIPRTAWTPLYLDAGNARLTEGEVSAAATVAYAGCGDGATFTTDPLDSEMEITGPVAAKLWISSSTTDADLFLVLKVLAPNGDEVTFQGTDDAHQPPALGWLRASHRRLDPARATPFRPFHSHDERQLLEPGEVYEVDVELWATSIVIPAGYRIALSVQGGDYRYPGPDLEEVAWAERSAYCIQTGVGPYTHADPVDRPAGRVEAKVTLHCGGETPAHLLLPVVPER